MPVFVTVKSAGLVKALDNVVDNLPKEIKTVNKKTAKRGESIIAKEITGELASITQRDIKKRHIKMRAVGIGFTLIISPTKRFSLKRFKPRQTKRGVSYKISKSKGRTKIKSAFIVNRLGGHVFRRSDNKKMKGKNKAAIIKLHGPSPWGVLAANNRTQTVRKNIQAEQVKQMHARIKYRRLKQSGAI